LEGVLRVIFKKEGSLCGDVCLDDGPLCTMRGGGDCARRRAEEEEGDGDADEAKSDMEENNSARTNADVGGTGASSDVLGGTSADVRCHFRVRFRRC